MPDSAPARPRIRPLAVVGTVAGVLLFFYTLQAAGPREILRQLRQIGVGFIVVLLLSAFRMAVRAKAWSLCVEDDERFTFAKRSWPSSPATRSATSSARSAGERKDEGDAQPPQHRPPAAFSSVVLENIFYSISVAIMVTIGTLAFLLGFRPTNAALTISLRSASSPSCRWSLVWWLLSNQPRLLSRFLNMRPCTMRRIGFPLRSARRGTDRRILLFEFAFHVAAVAEIYFLLTLLIGHTERTLLMA